MMTEKKKGNKKVFYTITKYKMRKWFRESPEPGGGVKQKLKKTFAWFALLSTLLLGKVGEWMAQEVWTQERKEDEKEIVVQPSTEVQADTLITWEDVPRWPDREPDPISDGKDESTVEFDPEWKDGWEEEITDWWDDTVKEKESPTKFTISTWLWYSIWWKAYMSNRIAWSWQLFKWTKWELFGYAHIDYDDPMHSTWSWKLTLSKSIYKWISLDWDYTFTWSWWNIVRLWIWYGWKIWEWMYWIKIYPLNTWWSPISAKVSYTTKIWLDWQLSSFIFVDFDNMQYYSETEYVQRIIEWIWLFLQIRLWWIIDGSIGSDSQKILWWVKISVK